ncbi:acyl-CoA dehydrogenase family protein [Amycolatopsis echigonensis]|uniref:Alkylation response protein AidB-like acyl-CoA dehydrogenase n=2 Tax=Amycolatopsis echigonensis TaxID=2576905 RepID=A0A2N3WS69_9PSEU|nr:acyl-CoA dehydrogenase family protein [Amycolatopsis niigatensis]PKV96693.1 alkylation response protein AidB-like acyl-CoA dehydrogenase [Amycolatopsis niigatensis]
MTLATAHPADTTVEHVLARIAEIQPLLERNAAQGEADRRVVEESIAALTGAGAFKIAQPRRYGGYGLPVRAMLDVSAAVAEADGGTAWVVALSNVCAWLAGLFSRQAQDDVWGDNPDAKVSGVLATTAETSKVDGGYRVTGRWYYNSGSWHADWAGLGIPLTDESGEVVDQGMALVPRTDLGFEDTWFVAGMRSSGSNCLIADDVFVPEHRVMSVPPAIGGQYAVEHPEEDLFRAALVPVLTLVLAGPQLGLGRKALQLVKEKAARKPISYTTYAAQSDSVAFQLQLAEAAMRIDSAHLHVYRAADDIDSAAANGNYPDVQERARVRADTGWAVDNITRAIDLLLSAHGAGSFAEVNPLQRIWRDSAVAARHAIVLPAVNYEVYGKALLGRDDQITPLI